MSSLLLREINSNVLDKKLYIETVKVLSHSGTYKVCFLKIGLSVIHFKGISF